MEVGATPPGLEECEDDTTNFVIKTTASGKKHKRTNSGKVDNDRNVVRIIGLGS